MWFSHVDCAVWCVCVFSISNLRVYPPDTSAYFIKFMIIIDEYLILSTPNISRHIKLALNNHMIQLLCQFKEKQRQSKNRDLGLAKFLMSKTNKIRTKSMIKITAGSYRESVFRKERDSPKRIKKQQQQSSVNIR